MTDLLPWLIFAGLVAGMLALDLGVFHRDAHAVSRREALAWSAAWIGLALAFNAGVVFFRGGEAGVEWVTGYLIEKSLSVDNVFVFLLIFSAFAVPPAYQHRVLFWGILGAVLMRAVLIAAAGFLIHTLHFVIYLFGAFLIFTGIKFLRDQEHTPDLEKNRFVRLARRLFPVTARYEGQKFFVRREGVLYATPLFLVLVLVESTDLVFAVDSIPAIYAVTSDPFIVFTSNIFAILGLRALYFVLAGYLGGLRFLKPALAAILVFVGTKMLIVDLYKVPSLASLGVIVGILAVALLASWRWPKTAPAPAAEAAHGH
ncbi:TerC family protein [Tepidiforma sp.]|uniref:TerC family protein n=1 Tax=Tepidiforma sp. TaxID=2682230 RepID=UPI002605B2B3|nr:TerC family protein [Tepidiforma sp.]MCX7617816.1 TerC family protein [Tepidiforma sp.]